MKAPSLSTPRAAAYLVAALLALPIAQSVYRIPVQVSDSLDVILVADEAPSTTALLARLGAAGTLRPFRYVQARWLVEASRATGLSFHTVFRGTHAALALALVLLFAAAAPVATWIDVAAFAFALTVLIGLGQFAAMLREGFPVNHFAEVAIITLLALVVAQRRRHVLREAAIVCLLAYALLLVESAVLIWVVIVTCAALRLPGLGWRSVIAASVLLVAYLVARQVLEVGTVLVGGHGSGFGGHFYEPDELRARFAGNPLPFIAYNIAGGVLSVLFSEPRYGVYSLLSGRGLFELPPVVPINIVSSALTTGLVVWAAAQAIRRGRMISDPYERLLPIAGVVLLASGVLCLGYIKDEILSVAGVFYALATYVALRMALTSAVRTPRPVMAAVLALFLLVSGPLWAFRTLGVQFDLRHTAFATRNDWARLSLRGSTPLQGSAGALQQRLRDEALGRAVTADAFLPTWGERYWVE